MAIVKKLTSEWVDFNGDYEKTIQDIELHDGRVFTKCWPNAGSFTVFSLNGQKPIPCKDVKRVRKCTEAYKF